MPLIPIALSLAGEFAPAIIKYFTNSDTAADVAGQVVNIAKTVTGTDTPDAAMAALRADPTLALQFQTAVMLNDADLDKAYLADRQSARKLNEAFLAAGMRNYRSDIMFFLAVMVILLLVLIIWRDPEINEYVKGIFTLVLGRFLGYLDNIYNYEYGTTRINKSKDATIQNLSNK